MRESNEKNNPFTAYRRSALSKANDVVHHEFYEPVQLIELDFRSSFYISQDMPFDPTEQLTESK